MSKQLDDIDIGMTSRISITKMKNGYVVTICTEKMVEPNPSDAQVPSIIQFAVQQHHPEYTESQEHYVFKTITEVCSFLKDQTGWIDFD